MKYTCIQNLEKLRQLKKTKKELLELGVDISQHTDPITDALEGSTSMMLCRGNMANYEAILEDIRWWLDTVKKVIEKGGKKINVNSATMFVKWCDDHYNPGLRLAGSQTAGLQYTVTDAWQLASNAVVAFSNSFDDIHSFPNVPVGKKNQTRTRKWVDEWLVKQQK